MDGNWSGASPPSRGLLVSIGQCAEESAVFLKVQGAEPRPVLRGELVDLNT